MMKRERKWGVYMYWNDGIYNDMTIFDMMVRLKEVCMCSYFLIDLYAPPGWDKESEME